MVIFVDVIHEYKRILELKLLVKPNGSYHIYICLELKLIRITSTF
jgi:hypothetical protein